MPVDIEEITIFGLYAFTLWGVCRNSSEKSRINCLKMTVGKWERRAVARAGKNWHDDYAGKEFMG